MKNEKDRKMFKVPACDRITDATPENPSGSWESEISGGRCFYEDGALHIGGMTVYGSHFHHPCGDSKIDGEMIQDIKERENQWAKRFSETPEYPYPLKAIYWLGYQVWPENLAPEVMRTI
jgi:hypothetical protein